jgi:hypothetical protein
MNGQENLEGRSRDVIGLGGREREEAHKKPDDNWPPAQEAKQEPQNYESGVLITAPRQSMYIVP